MSLQEISEKGNELETLRALRQKIAEAIDKTESGRDIAALSRQLRDILTRINEIESGLDENGEDEIAKLLEGRE